MLSLFIFFPIFYHLSERRFYKTYRLSFSTSIRAIYQNISHYELILLHFINFFPSIYSCDAYLNEILRCSRAELGLWDLDFQLSIQNRQWWL